MEETVEAKENVCSSNLAPLLITGSVLKAGCRTRVMRPAATLPVFRATWR